MTKLGITVGTAIPAGRYPSKLISIEKIKEKGFDTEELVDKVRFNFLVKLKNNSTTKFSFRVNPTLTPRSNLYKHAASMHPNGDIPADIASDADKFEELLFSYVNKQFVLSLGQNERGYNVVNSITPIDSIPNEKIQESSNNDDEIPF